MLVSSGTKAAEKDEILDSIISAAAKVDVLGSVFSVTSAKEEVRRLFIIAKDEAIDVFSRDDIVLTDIPCDLDDMVDTLGSMSDGVDPEALENFRNLLLCLRDYVSIGSDGEIQSYGLRFELHRMSMVQMYSRLL